MAVNAETIVDVDQDYKSISNPPGWHSDVTDIKIVDGILTITNPKVTENFYDVQYMVATDIVTNEDFTYELTTKIKSNVSGDLTVALGTWGNTTGNKISLNGNGEWAEYTVKLSNPPTLVNAFLLYQSGNLAGVIEIEWVKLTHDGTPVEILKPEDGTIIASFFDGNGATFGGWGATSMTAVEEDGKPCLQVVNEEAKDEWAAQIAINYDFTPDKTYYLNFDVKGTPFKGVPSGFQGEKDYANCGSLTKFNVTEEWTNVTIYGVPFNAGTEAEPNMPIRWLASIGKYIGTMYLTNVKLYTDKESGVESVEAAPVQAAGVYNLMGVKVADSIEGVAPGLYIANGKKVLVK